KEALDFYISSHPLAAHEDVIGRFSTHSVNMLGELGANQEVIIGGMLSQIRVMTLKKPRNGNTRYARCKLEDFSGSVECDMWSDDFVRYKDDLQEDRICFVRGAVDRTREEPGLILSRILSLEQAQRELTTGLILSVKLGTHAPQVIDSLASIL